MLQTKFVDDSTIEGIAPDGEKITWKILFPVPKQNQQHFADRVAYYYQKYYEDGIDMNLGYWIWMHLNSEGLAIDGGKADRDNERILLYQERERIGARIRELRKEKNIEAKMLAQLANIDAANLSRIEQGRYSVGLDILSKIAFALGAKIELVDSVEPKKP
ncbi:helix-turn-helix transcriptional regulator [Chitinophagaceae bacterium 26-R-25]|nr:helix-turn-helix transcriptional regulator [Chitinophagaceae bacterium 26-R-25]